MTAIDRKGTTFSIEDIDVRDVIESACDDIAYIDTKHITFEYSLQPTIIQTFLWNYVQSLIRFHFMKSLGLRQMRHKD